MSKLTIEQLHKYLDAVNTQYQIIGGYENLTFDSFKPRVSLDAPDFTQLHNLREAHLNISVIIKFALDKLLHAQKMQAALELILRKEYFGNDVELVKVNKLLLLIRDIATEALEVSE